MALPGCSKSSPAAEPQNSPTAVQKEKTPEKPSQSTPATSTTKDGRGPVIDGERFTVRQIIDQQQGGLPVGVFIAPEKWPDKSQVTWNYEHHSSPVSIAMSVENPANEEA